MEEKKLTRREAMERLTKIIALATGLSTSKVSLLMADVKPKASGQVKPVKQPNLQKLAGIRTTNQDVKVLKVLIHNQRSVFESEFGRVTPKYRITNVKQIPAKYQDLIRGRNIRPGMMVCPIEWSNIAACDAGLICGTNAVDVSGLIMGGCDICDQCSGTQKLVCPGNGPSCPAPRFGCEKPKNLGSFSPDFAVHIFDQFRTDTYIQALFREFNATTSQALAQEVQKIINQRRQTIRK
jgi:hypothetical protein